MPKDLRAERLYGGFANRLSRALIFFLTKPPSRRIAT